ncbi:hypothetical protein KY290_001323 [Solanum tuberosum]|uniref:Uncharacterized protein n=1 Tax=Solanum tuberosum TaxID=4113 RepID=A0ABQ7WP38_SOLTU|nr:hypothetical protein KY290_001323 [Solanum tuberosum]
MQTIHSDSAYKAFAGKDSKKSTLEMPLRQSSQDLRRTLASSDVQYPTSDSNVEDQQDSCPFTNFWISMHVSEAETRHQMDTLKERHGPALFHFHFRFSATR